MNPSYSYAGICFKQVERIHLKLGAFFICLKNILDFKFGFMGCGTLYLSPTNFYLPFKNQFMSQKNFQESIQTVKTAVQDIQNEINKTRQQTSDVAVKRFLSKATVDLESAKGYIEKAFALHEVIMQQQNEEVNGFQSYKPSRRMQEQNS